MAVKIFADTNIVIDFLAQRPFDLEELIQLFEMAEEHKIEIYISETVVTNSIYIIKDTLQVLRLLKITQVIFITKNSIAEALESNFKDKEDAILYHGALAAGLNYFLTRDPKDFIKFSTSKLPVIGVKKLLRLLS